jgi:glycosyltransferase involved in cell wall biosynthesis
VPLKTIAVDLTPVLPGGENGGAKVFAMELLRRLSALCPDTRFVLLTQAHSHDELAELDAANVRRVCVVGRSAAARPHGMLRAASRALGAFPQALRRVAGRIGYRMHSASRRRAGRAVLRDVAPDLLFCPFTAPTYRAPGLPCVCTIYDVQFRACPEFFAAEEAAVREGAFRDACRHATRLAAISDFSRDAAIAAGPIEADRIRTIALRLSPMPPPDDMERAGILRKLGLVEDAFLLYPANFWRHKNHEALLTAFASGCAAGLPPGLKLAFTGEPGAGESALREASARMGVAARVVFAGFLARGELAALMSAARGLIFPSLYEGFGLPVVEAMAFGVPVACSDAGALPEVAGGAALLFDPARHDAIAAALRGLATDEPLRARLVEAGRRRAREFGDAERMAREYLALFAEAAG